jgi:EAL and modified HD-GYP domain-containing signal transduction protein
MDVFVARQPIFDKQMKIYGYEILFRDGNSNSFPDIDGDTATRQLLSNSFISMDIEQISGGRKSFINFTRDLLLKRVPKILPREKIVVEILEDVEPEVNVVEACRDISQSGYAIALDDFSYRPGLKPLISIATLIKIDIRLTPLNEIGEVVQLLMEQGLRLLAEKVETHEEFQKALDMGFDYFQGLFFSKPKILEAKDIAPSQINLLQITAEANKEEFRFEELEKLIARDVSISYKFMRYINSAYFRRIHAISSIKQAIVLLGDKGVRRFVSLIAMAKLAEGKPGELIRLSIIRARMCELLGKHGVRRDESELYTLGLFSLIDAILDTPMKAVIERLPFSEEIRQALVDKEGELADYLMLVSCYEKGDWECVARSVQKTGVNEQHVPDCYLDAVGWADSYQDF